MTRNNPQGPILPLVSEIDRLFHQREESIEQLQQCIETMNLLMDRSSGDTAAHFELKPVMFNMLNSIRQFGGSPHEMIGSTFRLAKWSTSWISQVMADLCRSFLMRYNPPNMHTQFRNDIASFRQGDDESMYECWDRYRGCYESVPTMVSKTGPRIANNDYQFPTARLGSGRRTSGKLELDANDSVSAQLSAITNLLKNLQKPSDVREAKALSCNHCEGNHHATDAQLCMSKQATWEITTEIRINLIRILIPRMAPTSEFLMEQPRWK
ncbi:hypothetical protein GQ457_09G015780 [Hibiscus cannabinus]